MTKLEGDDGAPLEIKEGIVLDREGNAIAETRSPHQRFSQNGPKVFVWRPNPIMALLFLVPALILIFSIGLTILAALAVLTVIGGVVYTLTKLLRRL
jgi:hypothetical protein